MKLVYDVITVGSATVDVLACTEQCGITDKKIQKKFISFPVGGKILIEQLHLSIGGGGTNTAVSLSRLGHKVAYIGKVGRGDNANRVIHSLKKEYVDTSLIVQAANSRTGYSIIFESCTNDRTILTYRGSNNDLRYSEIPKNKLKTKWIFFSAMYGESAKTIEQLAVYASNRKIKIALSLNPAMAKLGVKKLFPLIKRTTILILNKEEAQYLVGKHSIEKNLQIIANNGPNIVAITDGAKGVAVYDRSLFYYAKPNKVKIIETTGAGDAFASSFLSGIMKKNDVSFAIDLGMTNAESVIQHHGAKSILLSYPMALKLMKKHPRKIIKKEIRSKSLK